MAENRPDTGSSEGKSPKKLRVFLRTFGCQMNVRDSEVVAGLLRKSGYNITDDPEKADIVIINTCSVRQHAEDKAWSEIGRLAGKRVSGLTGSPANRQTGKPIIGIIGCMAQNLKQDIFERAPNVSFVVGPADIDKIPHIIDNLTKEKAGKGGSLFERKIWETDGETRADEIYHTGFYEDKKHVFVVISEGCSNFCSYCVVPYVRGALRHRKHKDITKEIKMAIDNGITSVTLLGQNVNSYRDADRSFIDLIAEVNDISGLGDFGFITSHPKDTSVELFKAMADAKKLRKYLHLPVQSGSDKILRLMNRAYTGKFYLDLADKYRKIVKGARLSTDIIVGFPGETLEDFEDTYNLVKTARFNAAYIFKYSPRMHTEAAKLADTVSQVEKEKRHKLILDLQKEISNNEKIK